MRGTFFFALLLLSLAFVLGLPPFGGPALINPVQSFTSNLLQTLSYVLRTKGPITKEVSVSGSLGQTCYLHNLHHFFLQTTPACYNTDKPNIVKVVFQLRFPDLKLQCVQSQNYGPGLQSSNVPDDVTIFTQNVVIQVTTLAKFYSADRSETFIEVLRYGTSRYQIDPKYQGSEVEKNIPGVYFAMPASDAKEMLISPFLQAYQQLGAKDDNERVLLRSCF